MNLEAHRKEALAKQKEHKRILDQLRRKPPKNLDTLMQGIHDQVFCEIDCLSCANCCTTTGPLFTPKDVERISKYLRMKSADFESRYLRRDEEGDLVLKSVPCVFLLADNTCSIYQQRPKACREFPHTDRKKFHQINHLTIKNTVICPAASLVVDYIGEAIKI